MIFDVADPPYLQCVATLSMAGSLSGASGSYAYGGVPGRW
jgi:hypothetical protein